MATKRITITAANHDCNGVPVGIRLDAPGDFNSIRLVDSAGGRSLPCQWVRDGQGVLLSWVEHGLEKGASRSYEAVFSDGESSAKGDGGVVLNTDTAGRVDVSIGGELFTSYLYGPEWNRPYFHPVIGPYGDPVTRGFPMIEDVPGETTDHIHHRGVWVAYGQVNNVDNWGEAEGSGHTVHREFSVLEAGPVYGRAVAVSDWVTPDRDKVVLRETRDMTFHNTGPSRLVDIDLTLTAAGEDVLFGDTKEGGLFSLRVATSMDVSSGGRLESSFGGVNEKEIWGKRAQWCDYSGPVNGKIAGVTCFDHPKSFRHPIYWHARDYGLMCANPFGISTFEGEGDSEGYTLPAGQSLVFRNRMYVHKGDATEGKVAEKYLNYAVPPTVTVE
jgi:hypothetical protein